MECVYVTLQQLYSKDGSLRPPLPSKYLSCLPPHSSHGLPLTFGSPTIKTLEVCSSQFNFLVFHCSRHLFEPLLTVKLEQCHEIPPLVIPFFWLKLFFTRVLFSTANIKRTFIFNETKTASTASEIMFASNMRDIFFLQAM